MKSRQGMGVMRVLHVINQMRRSGAETSLAQILTGMEHAAVEHQLLSLSPVDNDFDDLLATGIPCGRPPQSLSRPGAISFIAATIRSRRPDLLHTTLFEADLAGRLAALPSRVPVLTSHVNSQYSTHAVASAPNARRLRLARTLDGVLARHATTYHHAITDAVADGASAALGVSRDRFVVVPRGRSMDSLGGPPTDARRQRTRSALGLQDAEVILNVGRQEPQKAHVDLIAAFAHVAVLRDRAVLIIAGRSGNSTPQIERAIAGSGVASRIRVLGQRDDVGDLLCAADVFAFPSRWEGLGGAVLEAMAMDVPIVATDIPSLREVLDGGRCGVLVSAGDPVQLARALSDLLNDRTRAHSLAAQARAHFNGVYTLERSVSGMTDLYRAIADDLWMTS